MNVYVCCMLYVCMYVSEGTSYCTEEPGDLLGGYMQ
jgi:hypothetical protein